MCRTRASSSAVETSAEGPDSTDAVRGENSEAKKPVGALPRPAAAGASFEATNA